MCNSTSLGKKGEKLPTLNIFYIKPKYIRNSLDIITLGYVQF